MIHCVPDSLDQRKKRLWGSNLQPKHTSISAIARVGPTVLVVTDLESHPRSMIFILSKMAYDTSY